MAVLDPINMLMLLGFATLLMVAALSDFRTFTIPNRLSAGILVLYPAYVLSSPMGVDWVSGLIAGGVVFVVTTAMFSVRWLGGGDAKLITAAAVWAGMDQLAVMVFAVLILGGLYSAFEAIRLGYPRLIWRRIIRKRTAKTGEEADVEEMPRDAVPYGVAIAGGGLYVAMMQFIASA